MPDDILLLLHNIGYIFESILVLALAVVVYVKDHKPLTNKLMIAVFLSVFVFTVSHVLGVNVEDPQLSRFIFNFNVSNIFIGVFITHCVFSFLGILKDRKAELITIYVVSIILTLVLLIFPDSFLHTSVPKMYFPNYYEGSYLYPLLIAWNVIVTLYFLWEMIRVYRKADGVLKNRIRYLFAAFFFGYFFGTQAYYLVLDIPFNPIFSSLMVPSFGFLFTYGILKYDLLDIKIIAKQAFIYSILVAIVGIIITAFNYLNDYAVRHLPGLPNWLIPFISAIIAVSIGYSVWRKLREGELLKYEFVTVVTHKFRTPLTHIKWAAENLSKANLTNDDKTQIEFIQTANTKLVELTTLLMNVSETEVNAYSYHLKPGNLATEVEDIIRVLASPIEAKKLSIVRDFKDPSNALFDSSRIKFVIQVLIENAVHYTADGGTITIRIYPHENDMVVSVTDSGIGISKEELPLIFTKFYRGKHAKLNDTEGMGVGLFISKEVINRHHGKIWVESAGEGMGATFAFSVPAVK